MINCNLKIINKINLENTHKLCKHALHISNGLWLLLLLLWNYCILAKLLKFSQLNSNNSELKLILEKHFLYPYVDKKTLRLVYSFKYLINHSFPSVLNNRIIVWFGYHTTGQTSRT